MAGVRGRMSGLRHLISFDEAAARMKEIQWRKITVIEVDVENSLDMVAAEDIRSSVDVPPYHRSAVDGYAVRHSDVTGATPENPVSLKISGQSGFEVTDTLKRGRCFGINTGARVPEGADAVIMSEYVTVSGDNILVEQSARSWENVSRKGEDISSGMRIISRGDMIRSWHIAALISVGRSSIKVYRKVKMGVMSTGNEIAAGSRSGVKNTTQPLLISYFRQGCTETENEGVYPDDYESIRKGIETSLRDVDILVVTGGSSVGSEDVSISVLSDLGRQVFRGVLIRPGRTVSLFEIDGKPVFSVSGLPVAALTSLEAFYDRFMIDIFGFNDVRQVIRARLTERLINHGGMRSFVRLMLSRNLDSLDATPLRITGSGLISSLLLSNGVTVLPESEEGKEKGEFVWVKLTGGPV